MSRYPAVFTIFLGALLAACGGSTTGAGPGGDSDVTNPVGRPVVEITSHATGEYVLYQAPTAASVTVDGTITDDTTILAQNVSWTVIAPDGATSTNQGNLTGAGTSINSSLDATIDQLGDWRVRLSYTDGALSAEVEIVLHAVDNLPPRVTLVEPPDADGDGTAELQPVETTQLTLLGRVRELDGDAVDPTSIVWTITAPDGTPTSNAGTVNCAVATDCDASFAYTFPTAGTYTVELAATDGRAITIRATRLVIARVNTPPTCRIEQPVTGGSFASGSSIQVSATVVDAEEPAGALQVAWYFDSAGGTVAGTGANAQLLADFPGAQACAAHDIICQVTDSFGATGSASASFMVNAPPTISFQAVVDNLGNDVLAAGGNFFDSTDTALTSIDVTLRADDADDSVDPGAPIDVALYDSLTGAAAATGTTVNPFVATDTTLIMASPIGDGRHTLIAEVLDSCGSAAYAQVEVIVAPQVETLVLVPGTDTWDVRALQPIGTAFFVGYRPAGGANQLALLSGASVNPPQAGTPTDYTTLLANLNGTRANDFAVIDGQLFIGTDDGLIRCPMTDAANGDYTLVTASCQSIADYTDAGGGTIADPQTHALLALPDGSLIAGTDAGAVWITDPVGALDAGVECLNNELIWDVTFDAQSGAVFGGTGGNFAFRWDPDFSLCDTTVLDDANTPMQGSDSVIRAVVAGADGVWFGSDHPSLFRLEVAADTWVAHRPAAMPAFVGDNVNDLAIDRRALGNPAAARDVLWAGIDSSSNTRPSVVRRDEALGAWTSFTVAQDGVPDVRVRRISVDANGVKWIATRAGLAGYRWP